MKHCLAVLKSFCLGVVLVSFAASPAFALDFSGPVSTWGGFYAGLDLGGTWGVFNNGPSGTGGDISGGALGGYNWQFDHFVLGGEADISGMRVLARGGGTSFDEDWNMTFRGRAGYAIDRYLPYVTAGLALTSASWTINNVGSNSDMRAGYVVGGGVDAFVCDNWFVRGEYLFSQVPNENVSVGGGILTGGSSNHTLRAAVGYKF